MEHEHSKLFLQTLCCINYYYFTALTLDILDIPDHDVLQVIVKMHSDAVSAPEWKHKPVGPWHMWFWPGIRGCCLSASEEKTTGNDHLVDGKPVHGPGGWQAEPGLASKLNQSNRLNWSEFYHIHRVKILKLMFTQQAQLQLLRLMLSGGFVWH